MLCLHHLRCITHITILALLVQVSRAADTWMTALDTYFQIACPTGQTIKHLESVHDNTHEDRVWNISCARLPNWVDLTECEWSGYQNNYDETVIFQCPDDDVITGIESIHDNSKEDRMWSFQCCNPQDYVTHSCLYTPFMNTYDNLLNYRVPVDYVLRGVESINDESHRDRIFKFEICKLAPADSNTHGIVG
ncbi:unnamed protein product [Lymnaea stagnalis]|uniref:Dermatopontin n=1 Tax=Lymnaea stagnalis TaxID=6523 RepID=A0AAV2IKL4_LYMST